MREVNYEPRYEHDCDRCTFLGNGPSGTDWYWCAGRDDGTMIERYSGDPPDYQSCRVDLLYERRFDHKRSRYKMVPPRDPLGWAFMAFHMWNVYVQGKEEEKNL